MIYNTSFTCKYNPLHIVHIFCFKKVCSRVTPRLEIQKTQAKSFGSLDEEVENANNCASLAISQIPNNMYLFSLEATICKGTLAKSKNVRDFFKKIQQKDTSNTSVARLLSFFLNHMVTFLSIARTSKTHTQINIKSTRASRHVVPPPIAGWNALRLKFYISLIYIGFKNNIIPNNMGASAEVARFINFRCG